jgi:hypothetical protein
LQKLRFFQWGKQVKAVEEARGNLREKFIHVMDRDAEHIGYFAS